MFDRDRWQEIFNAIKQNKLRSFLTAVGVTWGILMLVLMGGAGKGLQNGVYDGVKDFSRNSAFVWTQVTTKSYEGFKRGRRWDFQNSDMEDLKNQVPEMATLSPRLSGRRVSRGENVVRGLTSAAFSVNGDYPSYRDMDPCTMVYGRYINHEDIRLRRKVCIIGERVYEVMFEKAEDPVGKYLRVNGVYFMVVGVFRSNNPNINIGSDKKESIYLPFTTMQTTFNFGDRVHYFGVTAKPGVQVDKMMDKVMAILRENHKIHPEDKDAIGHFNVQEQVKQMNYLFLGINIVVGFVSLFTLIAGGVGISNIMLVIIKERTKEIGVQRAIGAKPKTILAQIVTESVFLTTVAGFVGLALGTMIISAISAVMTAQKANLEPGTDFFYFNPEISASLAFVALIVLVVIGAIAGLIPAYKAIKIKPIEALRHE